MRKMKPRTAGITSFVAGVGLMVGGASSDAMYDYWFHTPTPRESILSQLGRDAFHLDAKVLCLPAEEVASRPLFGDPDTEAHATYGWPSLIWLKNEDCAALETFVQRPPDTMLNLTPDEMKALGTFSHEYRHTAGTTAEDQADCEGVQVVHKIPLTLGTSAMTAQMVGSAVAERLSVRRENRTDEYAISAECKPDGDYDLRLAGASFPPIPKRN